MEKASSYCPLSRTRVPEVDEHQIYTKALMMRQTCNSSGWTDGVKGKSSDWAASWMPLWTLDSTAPKCRRRGTDRKDLTRYLSLCDVMEISADLAGDSENWCVTIATASSRWAFQWRLRRTQTFWASRAVHTRTRFLFFNPTATTFALPVVVLFIC